MADAPVIMDYEHNAIHEGRYFTWSDKQTLTTGSFIEYGFQTGENKIHVKPAQMVCSADQLTGQFFVDCLYTGGTATDFATNRNHLSNKVATMTGVVTPTVNYNIAATQAGGNFANQPAGSKVTVVSSNNVADKIPTITIYGTVTGATTTVTSEVIQLNGTTAVNSTVVTWQNILGMELSTACVGTITVKNGAAATIITIAPGTLSAGVATLTLTNAWGAIPRHDASGASTAPVGIIGKTQSGTVISVVAALNGATEENHGSTIFWDVTKVLIGAVASSVNTWMLTTRPGLKFSGFYLPGSTGVGQTRSGSDSAGSTSEFLLRPHTKYVIRYDNASSSSNVIAWSLQWYEEGQ